MTEKSGVLNTFARIEICADMPERFLNLCLQHDIDTLFAKRKDALTLQIHLRSSDLVRAKQLAQSNGFEMKIIKAGRIWRGFFRTRIFAVVLSFMIVMLLFGSKFFVWEISINGNEKISDGEILSALKECGVKSGSFWPGFSSDMIRSELLERIPELSWISVNMRGSHAEVLAVERREKPEMVSETGEGSITAKKEGFVRQVQTLEGRTMVKPGDIVDKEDVLISGVLDSSYAEPTFTRAIGSIKAETNSAYYAVYPAESVYRSYNGKEKHRFALIIGDNRINFYSDSSISHAFCDRIISVWNFELPKLFKLPISIVKESLYYYDTAIAASDEFETGQQLKKFVYARHESELGEGELLGEKLSLFEREGLYVAELRVRCLEEIGTLSPISDEEKYVKYNEKADDE